MPRVPTIIAPRQVQTGQVSPRISFAGPDAMASAGQDINRGLQNLAGGLERQADALAQRQKERQDYDDHLWSEGKYTEAQRKWIQWTQDVQKNGSENVVEQFNTGFTEYQQEVLAQAKTPGARDRLKLKLDDLGTQVFEGALRIEATNRAKNTVNTIEGMLLESNAIITDAPDMYAVQQNRLDETIKLSLQQKRISPEVAAKMQEQVELLAADAAEMMVATNPDRAKQILDLSGGIPWQRRRSILNQIEDAKKSNSTLFHFQQQELFKSQFESLAQTGKPVMGFNLDQYVASFPEKQQEAARVDAMAKIKVAETVFVGQSELQGKSPSQISQVLDKYAPKAGSANYANEAEAFHSIAKVADQQVKLQREDPFTYSRQDPMVNGAWKLVEDLPQDATPEIRASLTGQAMDASVNFQKSLNIPEGRISVMSNNQALQLASKINAGNMQQIQETFSSMQQSFGKYYANAFRDLARLPEGQRIDGAMQIVGMHLGQPFVADFVQAIRTPDSDYKLDAADLKTIREKVAINADFMSFSSAMTSANPGAVSYVDDFNRAIDKYAKSLLFRGKAENADDAVKQASNLILKTAYAFTEVNGASIAIKRGQDDGMITDDDVPLIRQGLQQIPQKLSVNQIDTSRFAFPPNLSDEVKKRSIEDTLRNDSFWVTNPQNDGAILYMNGAEGTSAPVKYKGGKPVEHKFLDLVGEAKAAAKNIKPMDRTPRRGFDY